MKDFKSKKRHSIVAGSPAIQEHEDERMAQAQEQPVQQQAQEPSRQLHNVQPSEPDRIGEKASVFAKVNLTEVTRVVQTRIPISTYQELMLLKLNSPRKISIGEMLSEAITNYIDARKR